jgi:hypothetical protein
MKRGKKITGLVLASLLIALVLPFSIVHAQGNGNGNGNGNSGGGGGGGAGGYTLIALPDSVSGAADQISFAHGLHELRDGTGELTGIEIVGKSADRGHYWALDISGTVLAAEALSHPASADPETAFTDARDVNDDGIIVGLGGTLIDGMREDVRALAWPDFLSAPIELPLPAGFVGEAQAFNINNHGLVVGVVYGPDLESAVVWGLAGDGMIVGPIILGPNGSWGADVNDAGTVVGSDSNYQAYRWQVSWDGTNLSAWAPEALSAAGFPLGYASAVNEHGDICGEYAPDGGSQTYLLTAEGQLIDMPPLVDTGRHGTRNIGANDLNDAPDLNSIQVVGEANVYRKIGVSIIDRIGVEVLWQNAKAIDVEKQTSQPTTDLALQWIGSVSNDGWLAGVAIATIEQDDTRFAEDRAVVLKPNK